MIQVIPVSEATDQVRKLVGKLDQVLSAEYPPEQRHGLALDSIFQPHIRFFIARLHGEPSGCGGVALFSEFAEVKRMYVREGARGSGVAQAPLRRIEREVLAAGVKRLRLETGNRQRAAMRPYERAFRALCRHATGGHRDQCVV